MHLPNDVIGDSADSQTAPLSCGECDNGLMLVPATHQCVTCELLLCELHSNVHPISRGTTGHGVRLLDSAEGAAGLGAATSHESSRVSGHVPLPLCVTHAFECRDAEASKNNVAASSGPVGDGLGSYYCITCGCVLCQSCILEATHSGLEHEVVSTQQAEEQQRGELKRLLPDINNTILPQLRTQSARVNSAMHDFDGNIAEVKRSISVATKELVQRILSEEKTLLGELEAFRAENRAVFESQADNLSTIIDTSERATRFGQVLVDNHSGARFVHDATWALDHLYDVTAKMLSLTTSGEDPTASLGSFNGSERSVSLDLMDNTSLLDDTAGMNPFDNPPPTYDSQVPLGRGRNAALRGSSMASIGAASSASSAARSICLPGYQYPFEPIRNPRVSFIDYSTNILSEKITIGVLSRANIDHQRCLLAPRRQLPATEVYGAGDDIVYIVTVVAADGSVVRGAKEVGLEVKAVLATSETVSEIPCAVERFSSPSEFIVSFQCKEPAEVLLYASIDSVQLPGSPAVVHVGSYPFEFDTQKSAPTVAIKRRGHLATLTGNADSVVLGNRTYNSGIRRWRIRLGGLESTDFFAIGICRQPFPTTLTGSLLSYTTVLGWTSKLQTLIKGALRVISMADWKDGDILQLQLDFDKRSLELLHCRTGEKSAMSGGIKSEVVPFFYMFSRQHKMQILPQPRA